MQQQVTERTATDLHRIAKSALDADLPEYDEWLYRYSGELRTVEGAERYWRWQLDHLALGHVEPAGLDVLDAGCGFGWALITLGLLGARSLRGIDVHEGMVRTVNAYPLPADLRDRLEAVVGTVSDMPYEDNSFDLLLSIEAISHYLDVPAFVSEAARVLRPGGVLIVSDGNNGLNPGIRSKTRDIWRAFEFGSSTPVHGHDVGSSYVAMREEIIRSRFALTEPEIAKLALNTSGFVAGDVVAAAERYVSSGEIPDSPFDPDRVPVHPDGQVIERLFDPRDLARDLERAGFRARAIGYWGGASGKRWIRTANHALARLSPVLLWSAPSFRIVATRA
jgi:SAM-dependent methyltransferase